ncbi:hypothetical protein PF011_g13053 [Phytophthora fragariae]|uniref:Uncharacterized protein n=1 Tax=Phytophthora fragariae TaxID=53985 RepID=A0A6A3K624_9STRA|nr:hypothetical protein PF011_g13053 [Phytophthora fragariae]
MAGKSREPREAAKLPKKSVKAAPKTVVRAAAAPDLHPNDENVIRAAAAPDPHPNDENMIRATTTPDPHPNDENGTSGPATLTPYERMKKLLAAKDDRTDTVVMNTVKGLKARLQEQGESGSGVVSGVIRMRLFWVSDHTYKQWNLVRLHLVDANAPESLEDQLKVFRDPYEERRMDIDSFLLTATLWNVESGSELLPPPGCIVDIKEYNNLRLYGKTQCQQTARLSQMSRIGQKL